MTTSNTIVLQRLSSQGIISPQNLTPAQLVSRLAAVQGQDYAGAKWSIGLRLPDATDQSIEQAIEARQLLRTWALRGTLHFVAAADIRWLLTLLSARTIASSKHRYHELGLDSSILSLSCDLLAESLSQGQPFDRGECYQLLEDHGISTKGQRGIFILQRACLEGLICQGSVRGRHPLFFSLEDSFAPQGNFTREEALSELSLRYFNTRGPATLQDFIWWSGLPTTEAKMALNSVKQNLESLTYNGHTYWQGQAVLSEPNEPTRVHLLPGFDEYLISYKDRSAALDDPLYQRVTPTNGMLPATLVVDGKVIGTWKRVLKKKTVEIEFFLFEGHGSFGNEIFLPAAERYGGYLERSIDVRRHEF